MTDAVLTLISFTGSAEHDEFLQPIEETENRTEVLATSVPVSRSEFYSAGQLGILPDFEFEMNPAEYSGQKFAEVFDMETGITERCRIYRTYQRTPDVLEVYCQRAAGLDEQPEPEPTPEPTPDPEDDEGGEDL